MCRGKEDGGRRCPMPAIKRKEARLDQYAQKRAEISDHLQDLLNDRNDIDNLLASAPKAESVQLRAARRDVAVQIKSTMRSLDGVDEQVKKVHDDLAEYRQERMEETQRFLITSVERYQKLLKDGAPKVKVEKARKMVNDDNTKYGEAQTDYDTTDLGFKELEKELAKTTLTVDERSWLENRHVEAKTLRNLARLQISTAPKQGEPQIIL